MELKTLRTTRDIHCDNGNLVCERLATMIIWRKLHGINAAAIVGNRLSKGN